MNTQQIQLKISLSDQLNDLIQSKAARLGIPVTQFVKHLIIKDVESEQYPVFKASERTIIKAKQAIKDRNKAVVVNDVEEYFKSL